MYCNACGKAIAEDARLCPYCGKVVGSAPPPKKLMRPRAHRKIAGVCAGLAEHFDQDVSLVRLICVFLTIATGFCPGIATYLLAWIIVPSEPQLQPLLASQQPATS
jgi:phage shock protein C